MEEPEQAGGGAICLEMGGVDHKRPGGGAFGSQGLEDAVEDTGLAPASRL